jgi:hypothetical protein
MKKITVKLISIIVVVSVLTLLIFLFNTGSDVGEENNVESLAKCLTDSGAELYGAYWCPHCQQQKDLFGDAAEFLPYVECTEEQEKCASAGIQGYPTWKFADGTDAVGGQTLSKLAELTGCEY